MELLEAVVARLNLVPVVKDSVFGIEELEEAISNTGNRLRTPTAYVILLGEVAGENEMQTITHQHLVSTVGVVLAIGNTRNPRGVLGAGDKSNLYTVRKAIRDSLLNFDMDTQNEVYDPPEYLRGRLVQVQDGVLWWQEEYRTGYYIRSQQ